MREDFIIVILSFCKSDFYFKVSMFLYFYVLMFFVCESLLRLYFIIVFWASTLLVLESLKEFCSEETFSIPWILRFS